jgi:hypothetical protein
MNVELGFRNAEYYHILALHIPHTAIRIRYILFDLFNIARNPLLFKVRFLRSI